MKKGNVRVAETRDDYLKMIQTFPLRKLRNEDEHAEAVKVLSRMLGRKNQHLSAGEHDYAEGLAMFVKDYDDRIHPFPRRQSTPLQVIRNLMAQNDMNSEDLGRVLGNKTAASLVLNGKRELSKSHIRKLAHRFKVDAGLFF
jgi:HTH-type transcriptional regulator/antitoxin HigA